MPSRLQPLGRSMTSDRLTPAAWAGAPPSSAASGVAASAATIVLLCMSVLLGLLGEREVACRAECDRLQAEVERIGGLALGWPTPPA